ncbi:universal stress protein [Ascidiimonas sp. W6]|uniref:universal stress protein n=1 Tax=Ascidiimonas meishanensis TaxID=3128903 RepID=UPI0030EC7D7C
MKKIILPTDFSSNARNAIDYAIQLFKDEPCEFILLNTFGAEGYTTSNLMVLEAGNPAFDSALIKSQKRLKGLYDILNTSKVHEGHNFEMKAAYNFLTDAVKDLIAKNDIYMVIMGTKGATGAREVWFGSNAVSVMEHVVQCPVMAIPENAKPDTPKEIIFPNSFKHLYRKRQLQPLLEIARKFDSIIRIMHISEEDQLTADQQNHKEIFSEALEGIRYSFHTLTNMDPETAIRCFVESRDIDMIAMISKKHNFLRTLFKKPVLREVGYHTNVPMLVMHRV